MKKLKMIVKIINKYLLTWIYNTSSRFQADIPVGGSTFTLRTPIDKSSLKVGDRFDI